LLPSVAAVVVVTVTQATMTGQLAIPEAPVVVTLSKIQTRPLQRELRPRMQLPMLAESNTVTPVEQ
jgi:hypothetical protein